MKAALIVAMASVATAAVPVEAQAPSMPGMTMPMAVTPPPGKRPVARKPVRAAHHAATGRTAPPATPTPVAATSAKAEPMPGMDMSGAQTTHDMAKPGAAADAATMAGTTLPAGNAPPPPVPTDHYADRQFGAAAMEPARAQMMRESGAQRLAKMMFNLAEYQVRDGKDGYRWDGEGWFGGDIDRVVLKSEGSGAFRGGVDAAEAQALYSHAIGPYFDLQAGVRHDFAPTPSRTYATIGVEGLAPYMFETEAAAFLSTKGELLGRLEGWYDQRLTQRLVLQPRVELNLSAQDIPETRVGAGLSGAELGLRLRYAIAREFAPYVGASYEAKTGRTADYARADGKGATTTSLVAGLRFWF